MKKLYSQKIKNDLYVGSDRSLGSDKNFLDLRILKVNEKDSMTVQEFTMPALEQSKPTYQEIKSKYGPLAITDIERSDRTERDRRFSINQLLRDPLSIEEEEKRIIDSKVFEEVNRISEKSKLESAQLGYEEGKKKGFEESLKEMKTSYSEDIAYFKTLISHFEQIKQDIFLANERFLIDLIYRIAKMILLKDLESDRNYIHRIAQEFISKVNFNKNIFLKLSKEDQEFIFSLNQSLEQYFGELKNIKIEVSESMKRGECAVETDLNTMSSSVEDQLLAVYQELMNGKS